MTIACEWGRWALKRLRGRCDVLILVDVLSFSTSVDVALSRGATVLPHDDPDGSIREFADRHRAVVAGPRGGLGPTVSPSSLLGLSRGTRLVLPTSNEGSLRLPPGGARLLTGCFRNVAAVAEEARRLGGTTAVVPVGETWPDEGWRFALEDWLAAGAIVEALGGEPSVEALAAVDAWRGARAQLKERLAACRSGRRLLAQGFAADLELAAELDASPLAPTLEAGAFTVPARV